MPSSYNGGESGISIVLDNLKSNVLLTRYMGLCVGCGTCEGVCPTEAVKIKLDKSRGVYLPSIDSERCTLCGICLKVCPGIGADINHLGERFLDSHMSDRILGRVRACYVGHATSHEIRYNSSSGGIVTALLIYALENQIIDGALVLGFSELNPLETKPLIATTPIEVISASGSKYCPAALNVGLREILERDGHYAVVGLPCHICAVRKLEAINSRIREKIVLHIGLFCANNNTYLATEYFFHYSGIRLEDVREIRYRGEGWPGKIKVILSDGRKRNLPRVSAERKWYRRALFKSAFHRDFIIPRCLFCPDHTCELADIACGDPWLKKYLRTERIGKSILIIRNQVGYEILKRAADDGVIVIEEVSADVIKSAQNFGFKGGVGGRIRLRKLLGCAVPDYGKRELPCTIRSIISALAYLTTYFSHIRWLWPLLYAFSLLNYIFNSIKRRAKLCLELVLSIPALRKR